MAMSFAEQLRRACSRRAARRGRPARRTWRWPRPTPRKAPATWASEVGAARPARRAAARRRRRRVTTGLKWAPEIGPKVRMSAISAAPVASVLARSATAMFPPARRSPMMPEPTTAATSSAVPSASARGGGRGLRGAASAPLSAAARPAGYRPGSTASPRRNRRGTTAVSDARVRTPAPASSSTKVRLPGP